MLSLRETVQVLCGSRWLFESTAEPGIRDQRLRKHSLKHMARFQVATSRERRHNKPTAVIFRLYSSLVVWSRFFSCFADFPCMACRSCCSCWSWFSSSSSSWRRLEPLGMMSRRVVVRVEQKTRLQWNKKKKSGENNSEKNQNQGVDQTYRYFCQEQNQLSWDLDSCACKPNWVQTSIFFQKPSVLLCLPLCCKDCYWINHLVWRTIVIWVDPNHNPNANCTPHTIKQTREIPHTWGALTRSGKSTRHQHGLGNRESECCYLYEK